MLFRIKSSRCVRRIIFRTFFGPCCRLGGFIRKKSTFDTHTRRPRQVVFRFSSLRARTHFFFIFIRYTYIFSRRTSAGRCAVINVDSHYCAPPYNICVIRQTHVHCALCIQADAVAAAAAVINYVRVWRFFDSSTVVVVAVVIVIITITITITVVVDWKLLNSST